MSELPQGVQGKKENGARIMAHADYNCCAICDDKLEYVGNWNAETKARICESCLRNLQRLGLNIVTVDQLIDWIKKEERDVLRAKLKELGFRACYYRNDVDDAVKSRGLEFDEKRRVV